ADAMTSTIGLLHESAREYLSYVLYDMATADPQQEDLPLGYCFRLAAELGLDKSFVQVVKKERKLSDKKTKALQQQCLSAYEKEYNPASAN
ncbi:MAG: hypothetical protein JST39_18590, partial [Bacteroidetes bacterium]|nr:hypothetical protein [Bacteroidota bacterium]